MTYDYALISNDIPALVQLLVKRSIPFRYDPKGRFSILLPDTKIKIQTLQSFKPVEQVIEVHITGHEGVFTMPEMQIRWDADSKRIAEESRIESESLNYPG
jgi:hypothetical protein